MNWQPIETVPEGEHVLLWFPYGERGIGGMECATVYRHDQHSPTGFSFWTHGGPNSGLDWEPRDSEKPTHWMPLPSPPNVETGIVEKVEFTQGGAGNQWTTISGTKYATFWDARTKDWKVGDEVTFQKHNTPLWSDTPPIPHASGIRKASAGDMADKRPNAKGKRRGCFASA